jgi:ribonuclease T
MNELSKRFRGFMPVVVDVECTGTDPTKHAMIELAAISTKMDEAGFIFPDKEYHYHIIPFEGAVIDPKALVYNKIDIDHPFRFAISETEAVRGFLKQIRKEYKEKGCTRAVLVGHNAWFDHHFLNAAIARIKITKHAFHKFTSIDTATLSALVFGQTVLAKALHAAGIPFNEEEAHSAIYDTRVTAELFCKIVNRWKTLGGLDEAKPPAILEG